MSQRLRLSQQETHIRTVGVGIAHQLHMRYICLYVFSDRFSSCMRGSEQMTQQWEKNSDRNLAKVWNKYVGWRDGT